jgi:predicted dehydrogenase
MYLGVVGLGSMGRRRVRDLLRLGHTVIGFDRRSDRNERVTSQFGIPTVSSFEAILNARPEALVISTPPDTHVHYYQASFEARIPFFSEANIVTPPPQWFSTRAAQAQVQGYVSATWRFHPLFAALRQEILFLDRAGLYTVHHHYADYLPRWHPWEPYDEFYAGKSHSTCAAREMVPFELEWMCWIFGPVQAVCGLHGRCKDWISDIDDTYLMLLEFDSGLRGSLTIELHSVAAHRAARIAARDIGFVLDVDAQTLRKFADEAGSWEVVWPRHSSAGTYDFELTYLAEIRTFVEAVEHGAPYPKTWEEDRHLSDVLVAAEMSWRRRKWVCVDEASQQYDGTEWLSDGDIG